MDKDKAKLCIEICTEAYATLEAAKQDCNDSVESAVAALCDITEETEKKDVKAVMADRKDDIKSIKKIAKAIAKNNLAAVKSKSSCIADMVDELQLPLEKP